MAPIAAFFNKFCSLFFLLLYLACFIFATNRVNNPSPKSRKPLSSLHKIKSHKPLSSSWTFLKHLFCTKSCKTINADQITHSPTPPSLTSARSSQHSLVTLTQPELHSPDPPHKKSESEISADNPFSPLRNDIFPCTACGEIFPKPQLLEHHQAIKHAVSELIDGDAGSNIVRIIFKAGWPDNQKSPNIDRILKIHNSPKIMSKFEEYREMAKSKAARNGDGRRRDERCMADGNELMRFHCSTFLCDLGHNGNSNVCKQEFCNVCEVVKSGFSAKMDGISTLSSSWKAHVAIPEEMEAEFKFMNVKRAMLVCRVIAGRVGYDSEEADKEEGGFDSFMMTRGGGGNPVEEEELVVFNPRAVLPCFVIVYAV